MIKNLSKAPPGYRSKLLQVFIYFLKPLFIWIKQVIGRYTS